MDDPNITMEEYIKLEEEKARRRAYDGKPQATVHFRNDQFALILGYGDLVQGNIMINKVYYAEGLNHYLFLVGQFYDADLEDETLEILKDFLKMIQRNLQAQVIIVRTDRGTKFLNKTLYAYFKEEGIEHQTSTPRTPEQNGVVERQNRTLVEAARTMLSASKLPLDGENLNKMKEKGDPCILVGYSTQSKGYIVYNKRTRLIVESIHIKFDEIKEIRETFVDNNTSGLVLQRQKASDYDNSGPAPQLQNVSPSADTTALSQQELDLLFGPLYDEFFTTCTSSVNKSSSPTDNSTQQDTKPTANIHPSTEPISPTTTVHAEENNDNQAADAHFEPYEFVNPFCTLIVQTRRQLATDPEMCMFALTVNTAKPKNIKEVMADSRWIEAMQDDLHQFDRLQVWEVVNKPFGKKVIKLKWYRILRKGQNKDKYGQSRAREGKEDEKSRPKAYPYSTDQPGPT
ncbi:putative reverse transcriptase domain-containing protein [Tanacetum coccineum]